ncbi:hypothetical protein WJX74_002950 [Apatococcus lobatus]|uniref:Uncharacterized protein n=2 Tax=Apatococcus TaxID=904362 RepID=A0AAW1SY56_9CHLO
MRSLLLFLFLVAVARTGAKVPLQWEAWSSGAQRQLLSDWAGAPGSAPSAGCPPAIYAPFGSWLSSWQSSGVEKVPFELSRVVHWSPCLTTTDCAGTSGGVSPAQAVQAADSALLVASPVVASVTFAALTYMWATSAAYANQDAAGTKNAINAASTVLSNFDSSVPVSLQTATAGVSRAVAQLASATAQNKAVVATAVLQSIAAMEGCISVARLQGYGSLVTHYSKAVAQATNCVTLDMEGHKDAGCAATILTYTYVSGS